MGLNRRNFLIGAGALSVAGVGVGVVGVDAVMESAVEEVALTPMDKMVADIMKLDSFTAIEVVRLFGIRVSAGSIHTFFKALVKRYPQLRVKLKGDIIGGGDPVAAERYQASKLKYVEGAETHHELWIDSWLKVNGVTLEQLKEDMSASA